MRKRVKNTVFFRNLSEDSSADASADAPAIINIRYGHQRLYSQE